MLDFVCKEVAVVNRIADQEASTAKMVLTKGQATAVEVGIEANAVEASNY